MSFFNKELSKTIMPRTKLQNFSLQNRSEENRIRCIKQINSCVSLLRKTKKEILWKSKWKACCRQQALLENGRTSPI